MKYYIINDLDSKNKRILNLFSNKLIDFNNDLLKKSALTYANAFLDYDLFKFYFPDQNERNMVLN